MITDSHDTHTGCEMCGGTGTTPYHLGLGYYCNQCVSEHEENQANPKVQPVANFDLSTLESYCAVPWYYVFEHAQTQAGVSLRDALMSWPAPYEGYSIKVFETGVFELKTKDGEQWLVSEKRRESGKVLGVTPQQDGNYIFARRHCMCPDGSVLFFD